MHGAHIEKIYSLYRSCCVRCLWDFPVDRDCSPPVSEGYKIKNPVLQRRLMAELRKHDIKFTVGADKMVLFSPEYSAEVHNIARNVMASSEGDEEVFGYVDPRYTDLLEKRLEAAGVEYKEVIFHGQKSVSLRVSDKHKWEPIEDEITDLYVKRILGERGLHNR